MKGLEAMHSKACISLLVLTLVGCSNQQPSTEAAEAAVSQYGFSGFKPPRDGNGVGTIIDYVNSREDIVERADRCILSENSGIKVERDRIPDQTYKYNLNQSSDNKASVPKEIAKYLSLEAAFNLSRVKNISVELKGAFQENITKSEFKEYRNNISKANPKCQDVFNNRLNYVIYEVLGANEITISFEGDNSVKLDLSADILEKIPASSDNQSVNKLENTVSYKGEILVGFKAWNVIKKSGFVGGPIELRELTLSELKNLRK